MDAQTKINEAMKSGMNQKEFEMVFDSLVKEQHRENEVARKKRSMSDAGIPSEIVNLEDEESCVSNRTGLESGKLFQECLDVLDDNEETVLSIYPDSVFSQALNK